MVKSEIIRIFEYYYTQKEIIMSKYENLIELSNENIIEIDKNLVVYKTALVLCFTALIPLVTILILNNV